MQVFSILQDVEEENLIRYKFTLPISCSIRKYLPAPNAVYQFSSIYDSTESTQHNLYCPSRAISIKLLEEELHIHYYGCTNCDVTIVPLQASYQCSGSGLVGFAG